MKGWTKEIQTERSSSQTSPYIYECIQSTYHNMHNNNMHFLLVTFPAQGHINPGLQLAKRLIDIGVQVTFSTTVSATRSMVTKSGNLPDGLSLAPFSDGYDDGSKPTGLVSHFMSEFKRLGSKNLTKLLLDLANEGRPVTTIIYSLLLPWVTQLASNFHIPSTLLWIQPAMVFDIYYYYFQGHYRDALSGIKDDVSGLINLPGLPPLTGRDIPSFVLPSSPNHYSCILELLEEQFKLLEEEREKMKSPLTVLVNTFEALEGEALTAVDRYKLTGVGPLVPSAFLDCKSPSDKSFGGTTSKEDYIEWLNTKEESSVVYVSFGTMAVIAKKQMEEIARALVDSGKSFLWVIRKDGSDGDEEKQDMILDILSKQAQQGLIVPWCSQVEVLTHPSVGCFVTHCGWNSTLETLVSGVPVVAFPQWTDQGTNAKLMEDVSGTGVRVKVNEEDKILECEELRRCLEIVMGNGEKGREMRMNAKKWKDLARKAVEGGGSSDNDLRSFVDKLARNAK